MAEPSATLLIFETTTGDPPTDFLGPSSDIVYFISMAHGERYGAAHPLARAAFILKRKLRVNMNALLTFGDARPDNAEEAALLEKLWQDAAPVAEQARKVADAIEGTEELRDLTIDFPELPDRLRDLADMATWAAENGAKIRLTYVL